MATERVGIEIELMGYDEAMNRMRSLERELRGLGGRRARVRVEARVDELKKNYRALEAELRRLQNLQNNFVGPKQKGGYDGLAQRIKQVREEMRQTNTEAKMLQNALRNVKTMSVGQVFNSVSSKVGHLGSALQSAGNALTRLSTPMRLLTGGLGLGAGFAAIGKIEEGFASGFARYDTMKKYPKMMAAFGYSAEQAQKSIDALDQSVRGLPTGLDEMVDMSQRFTATTGDIEKGTKLAIAANNAFLASMSTDTQRYQGMMQLQDVLGGKKMNSREWNSLVSSMNPAIVKMGESMGYTSKNMGEWIQKVRDGKVANEEFIDTLIKVGTEGGEVAKMAENSKDTWQAFSSNVGNAFSRMAAGVIQSMDEVVKTATGGEFDSVNKFLSDSIIPKIDDLTKSAKKWIKANPDKIIGFFDKLKGFDWKGLGKGFLDGFKMIGQGIEFAMDKFGGGNAKSLGKFIALAGPLGSAITALGGVFKATRHLFGGIAAVGSAIAGGSVLGGIGQFISGIGKLKGVEKATKNAKAISKFGSTVKPGTTFKGFLPAIEAIAGVAAITIEVAGAAAIDAKLLHIAVDNVNGIVTGMDSVFKNVGKLKSSYTSVDMGDLRNAVETVSSIYDIIYGEKTSERAVGKNTVTQRSETGLNRFKKGKLKGIADSIGYMVDIFGDMNTMNKDLGKLKGFKGFDDETSSGIEEFVSSIGAIYDDLDVKLEDIDPTKAEGFGKVIGSAKSMFKTLGDMTKDIPAVAKQLAAVTTGGIGGGGSVMQSLKTSLTGKQGIFTAVNSIYTSIQNDLMGDGMDATGERFNAKGIGKLTTVMDSVKTMFTSITDIATELPKLQEKLAPMMQGGIGGSGLSSVTSMLQSLMKNLGSVVTAVNGIGDTGALVSNMENLKKAITSVKGIATSLEGLGGGALASTDGGAFVAINNLKQMITQIGDALNVEAIAGIQAQVDAFKESIDSMFEALNKSFSNVKITVNINGQVKGADKLISEINSAGRRIRMAVNGLPSNIYRTVNVHITPNVSTGSYSMPTFPSSGGYSGGRNATPTTNNFATGGHVHGASGRDKVPANLTSGEFVQRKRAVEYFGAEFMRRVNNLDVAGAMRALSARVGKSAVPRGTVINNNTTNNYNVNTNQNINTNNPHFAFKRSNRYVMAL